MGEPERTTLGLCNATGALLMLNKDERLLIKELLVLALKSESVKDYLRKKLGGHPGSGKQKRAPHGYSDYIQVGEKLLENMGYKLPETVEKNGTAHERGTATSVKRGWIEEKDGSYTLDDTSMLKTRG